MAAPGDVLFQMGQNDGTDSDIWDDTALIAAYDKAISSVKAEINGEQSHEGADDNHSEPTSQKATKKGKHKRKKRRSTNKNKWKVGDQCSAQFSEDGLVYDGVIKSVNYRRGTCWVTYTGYGNEEEKDLADLMPPGQSEVVSPEEDNFFSEDMATKRMNIIADLMLPIESEVTLPEEDNYLSENGYDPAEASAFSDLQYPSWSRDYRSPQPPVSSHYPPPPPDPRWQFGVPWPTYPPQGLYEHLPPPPGPYQHMRGPTNIPHPPPLSMADGDCDQEALYAMLMSWYMSGYHTGYFQGMKSARKRHGTMPPSAER